ncbi:hypothetical protein JW905_07340, partial [bacterium]|nr:hypothetical protein [candidate division CSSED10-310 bacterium]
RDADTRSELARTTLTVRREQTDPDKWRKKLLLVPLIIIASLAFIILIFWGSRGGQKRKMLRSKGRGYTTESVRTQKSMEQSRQGAPPRLGDINTGSTATSTIEPETAMTSEIDTPKTSHYDQDYPLEPSTSSRFASREDLDQLRYRITSQTETITKLESLLQALVDIGLVEGPSPRRDGNGVLLPDDSPLSPNPDWLKQQLAGLVSPRVLLNQNGASQLEQTLESIQHRFSDELRDRDETILALAEKQHALAALQAELSQSLEDHGRHCETTAHSFQAELDKVTTAATEDRHRLTDSMEKLVSSQEDSAEVLHRGLARLGHMVRTATDSLFHDRFVQQTFTYTRAIISRQPEAARIRFEESLAGIVNAYDQHYSPIQVLRRMEAHLAVPPASKADSKADSPDDTGGGAVGKIPSAAASTKNSPAVFSSGVRHALARNFLPDLVDLLHGLRRGTGREQRGQVEWVLRELLNFFTISSVQPEAGTMFNEALHEKVEVRPDRLPRNMILDVLTPALMDKDEIISKARVVVSSGAPEKTS